MWISDHFSDGECYRCLEAWKSSAVWAGSWLCVSCSPGRPATSVSGKVSNPQGRLAFTTEKKRKCEATQFVLIFLFCSSTLRTLGPTIVYKFAAASFLLLFFLIELWNQLLHFRLLISQLRSPTWCCWSSLSEVPLCLEPLKGSTTTCIQISINWPTLRWSEQTSSLMLQLVNFLSSSVTCQSNNSTFKWGKAAFYVDDVITYIKFCFRYKNQSRVKCSYFQHGLRHY